MIDNITYFTFDVSKCNDDAIKCYKKRIIKFSKLEYFGLHIDNVCTGIINFSVDTQLIRKLKILNLDNKIEYYSSEYLILDFIQNSRIDNNKSISNYSTMYWYTYDDCKIIDEINNQYQREIKVFNNKNKSKMDTQKIKQYNNKRNYRK